jgi:hypothetical protein
LTEGRVVPRRKQPAQAALVCAHDRFFDARTAMRFAWTLAGLWYFASCGVIHAGDDSPRGSDVPAASPDGVPQRYEARRVVPYAAMLAAARWKSARIPVCWENPDESNAAGRRWTRDAVAATWEKESALQFTGWGPCRGRHAGIRILVEDAGPHVVALGRRLAKRRNGMVLNFSFHDWSPSCQGREEHCAKVIAVHEFGHAIGLAHEQNRHDAPGECRAKRQGAEPDTHLTPYDPASVMNYCNFKWNNDGVLSPDDVAAVRMLYGAPRPD